VSIGGFASSLLGVLALVSMSVLMLGDKAPIEWLVDKSLLDYGGGGE
jgi:hypothetical protein